MRSFDYKAVRDIIVHPDVYPYVSDDGAPEPIDFVLPETENYYHLMFDGGVFTYHPINYATAEVHTCVLPKSRGKTVEQAKKSIHWMFNNTHFKK